MSRFQLTNTKTLLGLVPLAFARFAGLTSVAHATANPGPVVRLFPTNVLEDIRETGQVAEDMENNLQEVIYRLDLQQQLYKESLCEGSDGDSTLVQDLKRLQKAFALVADTVRVGNAYVLKV